MADNTAAQKQDERDAAKAQQPPIVAGTDLDARKRAAKTALASAISVGDDEAADAAQKELDAVNDELSNLDRGSYREPSKEEAAKQRQANAAATGQAQRTAAPQGRTAAPKDTTNAPATGGKTQK